MTVKIKQNQRATVRRAIAAGDYGYGKPDTIFDNVASAQARLRTGTLEISNVEYLESGSDTEATVTVFDLSYTAIGANRNDLDRIIQQMCANWTSVPTRAEIVKL